MTDANTNAPEDMDNESADSSDESDSSTLTVLINNLKNTLSSVPDSKTITRNETSLTLVKTRYTRFEKKEEGCQYLGLKIENVEQLNQVVAYLGKDEAIRVFQNFINQLFQSSHELAVESGAWNDELHTKAVQELTTRGEPRAELEGELKNLTEQQNTLFDDFRAKKVSQVDFLTLMAPIADRSGYIIANLAARVRKPRKKKSSSS